MKSSKLMIMGLMIGVLALSGCQSVSQKDYAALESELATVKEELRQTRDELRIAQEQLQLQGVSDDDDLMASLGISEIENKDEKIAVIKSSAEELASLVASSYSGQDISPLLDEFVADQSIAISYVYFGTVDDVFMISPATELPEDYRFTQRPAYKSALGVDINIAEIYIDAIDDRPIQTITKAVYVDDKLIGVVGIDAYLD
ncbi:MAG: hypothetical protein JXO44_03165 [Clostridia bacterium]|nr:hypothetical protein [Clostridia bacterium]